MKVIGLDLGLHSLGISISDQHQMLARGLENLRFEVDENYQVARKKIASLLIEERVETIVLGYPKNMDGTIGAQAIETKRFKQLLEQDTNVPIVLWDERLTTKMANTMMRDQKLTRKVRHKNVDKSSAIILLQSYLDTKK